MERKLLLFSFLVLFSDLAVSELPPGEWSLLQGPQNINYASSQPPYFNPLGFPEIQSEPWSISPTGPQNQLDLNSGRPLIGNVAHSNYQENPVQLPLGPTYPQQYNNFAQFQHSSKHNSLPSVTGISPDMIPNDKEVTAKQEKSVYEGVNSGPSEGLWRSPVLQQDETLEGSQNPITLVNNYPEPYVDQQQRNYANYELENQRPDLSIPSPNGRFHDYYRQGWPIQNQYNRIPIPSPVGYVPWSAKGYQNTPPTDPQYIEPNILNKYNRPAYPAITPVDNPYQNADTQSVLSQTPVNDQSTSNNERYIIIHPNNTYEQIDNLNEIVVDEFNVAHIITKEVPNHLLAIIKVEDKVKEIEYEKPFEIPYDTGISKISHDTSWNTNNQDYLGTPQNGYPGTLRQVPDIEITSEDTDMDYFNPEYIMPIEFDSINNTTDTALETTRYDENVDDTNKNHNVNLHTQPTADIPKWTQSINDGDLSPFNADLIKIAFVEPSEEGFHYNNPNYNGHKGMSIEVMPGLTKEIVIETNSKTGPLVPGDGYTVNIPDDPVLVSQLIYGVPGATTPFDARDHNIQDVFKPTHNSGYGVPRVTTNNQARDDNIQDVITPPQNAGNNKTTTPESGTLRSDLEIDVANLKKIVSEPFVWFRPDEQFWEKVTKGEEGFDAVSFYDVQCEPVLVERYTTVHHYQNGTEIEEYTETIWNNPGDVNPKVFKSNKIVRNPSE